MNALIEGMREVRASFGEALSSVDSTKTLRIERAEIERTPSLQGSELRLL